MPPSTPPWLAIVLALIALVGVMFAPALAERVKRGPKALPPATEQNAGDRADTALAIVQDAMDDLQRRLDEATEENRQLRLKLERNEGISRER